MGSILQETKGALGLAVDAVGFDPELILHINSVLSDMNQLGVGPDAGFAITDATATWENFLGNDPRLNAARSLAFLQVKMLFDPPQTGYVLTSYEKMIEQAQWRLTVQADGPSSMLVGGHTSISGNSGDEHILRLHNPSGQTLINAVSEYTAEFIPLGSTTGTPVVLDRSEIADGILSFTLIIQSGKYIVRRVSPQRTLITIEVTVT